LSADRPRWARPVVPLAIEPVDQVLVLGDGRRQAEVQLVLSEEDVERMRQGYVCAKCLQVFERPWPERCFACGAPIRTKQAEYFAREYGGEVVLGSRISLADELARLKEEG
jgi:hypothetical protein